jgi:hypothetical protein
MPAQAAEAAITKTLPSPALYHGCVSQSQRERKNPLLVGEGRVRYISIRGNIPMTFTYQPIGIIHTPFKSLEGMPIQPARGRGRRRLD